MEKTLTRNSNQSGKRLPDWLKVPMPVGSSYARVRNLMLSQKLNTICVSGNCPNKGECWSAGTASFMILGNKCTRNCRFCAVQTAIPDPVDWDEPERLASTIHKLELKHCVITSVDRDDLPDGGAQFWNLTIQKIKEKSPGITIETLIPDFQGNPEFIAKVIQAQPNVISHNLETVRRLTTKIRSNASYSRSLEVIRQVSSSGIIAKSGIMLGLGETGEEVEETMEDLRAVGCCVHHPTRTI